VLEGKPNRALRESWTPPPSSTLSTQRRQFKAWCQARTGVPIVDAAMNQLAQQGWLPNRARMIVACYLCRDLGVDWRWGERWFAAHLRDYDPCSNNGGWQWAAGSAPECLAPGRRFNPSLQARRFDASGHYVQSWLGAEI
jgi:deoxyribodipyrimidine photo-lyase